MAKPRPRVIERLTNWLTPPAAPERGLRFTRAQTSGFPAELLATIHSRPYDPELIDLFRPDPLAREKGWGIYTEMMGDAQVQANMMIKRYGPISSGWSLNQRGEGTEAEEIKRFCEDNLNALERTVEEIVGEGLESTFTGLSIGEAIYRVEKRGLYKGRLMLDDIQYRPPSVLDVRFDDAGRVQGVYQLVRGVRRANDPGLPPYKFVIHSYRSRYGSPYGVGDARAVYRHWWAKDFLMRSWAIFMERYGAPSIIGRESEDMSDEDADNFEELLKAIQHQGHAILPPDWKIEWLAAPNGSGAGDAFLTAIEWHDRGISKAMLGSTMTTDQPTTGLGLGGGAVAGAHADTRDLILAGVKRDAERVIVGRQILWRLVELNFGPEAAAEFTPTVTFNPTDLGDMQALAGIIKELIGSGVVDPLEPWIRERLHVPRYEESREALKEIKIAIAEADRDVQAAAAPPEMTAPPGEAPPPPGTAPPPTAPALPPELLNAAEMLDPQEEA